MNQTKSTSKKLLALLLALIMTVSLLPMSVFATEPGTDAPVPGTGAVIDESDGEEETEPADQQEEPAESAEPAEGAEPAAEELLAAEDGFAVQTATEIKYVTKDGSGKTLDDTFYRIFLLDCGRKYFKVSEIEDIIDQLAENHYTHIELAFGNEGLRFLLDDMELTVDDTTYSSENVRSAIRTGNTSVYNDTNGNALSQTEMDAIIKYANEKGIGVIPLFNAPGHMFTVVKAMEALEMSPASGIDYKVVENAGGGKTANYAVIPTSAAAVNFVQALMQKYVKYFADKHCTMFNIGADESGITLETYPYYAKLVNSHAAMVQNAGMVAMAFNDGIYNPSYADITKEKNKGLFDSNIVISYWDAGGGTKYAQASQLAGEGHKINSTHNNWYYVLGNINGSWASLNTAKTGIAKVACNKVDSTNGFETQNGCTLAVWCDYPANTYSTSEKNNIKYLIEEFANNNTTYFKAPETPKEPELTVDKDTVVVGGTVTFTLENYTGETDGITWQSSDTDVLELNPVTREKNSIDAYALSEGEAEVTATVDDKAYTKSVTVTEQQLEPRTITVTVGGIATDVIEGKDYSAGTFTLVPADIASVSVAGGTSTTNTLTEIKSTDDITDGAHYLISNNRYNSGNNVLTGTKTTYTVGSGYYATTFTGCQLASTSGSDIADNTNWWTITKEDGQYYVQYNDGNYLYVANNTSSTSTSKWPVTLNYNENGEYGYWTISRDGYYMNNLGSSNSNVAGGWNGSGAAADDGSQWTIRKIVPTGERTNITFKGLKEGTTYVTIGNVRYTINVVAEDLDGVSLPIQTWITNNIIKFNEATATSGQFGNNKYQNAYYLSIEATAANGTERVNSEDGMALSQLIPDSRANMKEYDNVYFDEDSQTSSVTSDWEKRQGKKLVLFQGVLHKDEVQYKLDKDYSNTGTVFQYVRYLGGKWSVSADRINWVDVGTSLSKTTESSTSRGIQIVAYYMMRSEITKEVTTDVADWGYVNTDTAYNTQITNKQYVMLDFAVKYEGGTRNPDSFPQNGKTFVFHCNTGDNSGAVKKDSSGNYYRQLNNFRGVNTGDYEIYMVTVTMTADSASNTLKDTTSYTYNGEEQIVWAIDEATRNNCGLKEYKAITSGDTVYSGCKVGGDPYVRGVEVYNQHGALITYYIRLKTVPEDALIVHYINQNTRDEFYNYSISVKQDVTFSSMFGQVEPNSTQLTGNTVVNKLDVTETVTADLKKIAEIGAQYKYSEYTCVDTKRSEDGKEVFLYYNFITTKTFVVDFGLPLTIKPSDINESLGNANIESMAIRARSQYADIQPDLTDYSFTYKLTATIDGPDEVTVTYYGTNPETNKPDNASYTITIIPASTVYYEDSFVTFSPGTDESGNSVAWSAAGQESNDSPDQALEELGGNAAARNVYGYDPAYNDCTTFSMGSAKKVTVDASVTTNPTAKFTFKGTGFDIISLTDNNSGAIIVNVTGKDEANKECNKNFMVNNYYGYAYKDGEWQKTDSADGNALYQIPVMKVTDLVYGTYDVTITVAYGAIFDKTGDDQYSFWLDAIRVYDPMGPEADKTYYQQDGEGWAQYIELRNQLIENNKFNAGKDVVFIDGSTEATVEDYKNGGPNNEVYLLKDQSIAFQLNIPDGATVASVHIGAKAPMGSATLMVNGNKVGPKSGEEISDIATATEMYYDITDEATTDNKIVTITNGMTGSSILSLTNVKVTFTSATSGTVTFAMSEAAAAEAVQMVRAMYAPAPEPDPEPFAPERFEASWNRSTVKVGQKATLTVKTSEDVEAITVDGVTIDTYRTRTQRTGWGWNAKRVTYREFTYTITASEAGTLNCSIVAFNAEGVDSEPITAALTVEAAAQRPSWGGWLGNLFGRWF